MRETLRAFSSVLFGCFFMLCISFCCAQQPLPSIEELGLEVVDNPEAADQQIRIYGSGFGANESIIVRLGVFERENKEITQIQASETGDIDNIVTLPDGIRIGDGNIPGFIEALGYRPDGGVQLLSKSVALGGTLTEEFKGSTWSQYVETVEHEAERLKEKRASGEYGFMKFEQTNVTKDYYDDGSLRTEWFYDATGWSDALVGSRQYYPDGTVKSERHELDVNGYGRFIDYYSDGAVKSDIVYEGGKEISRNEYQPNNQMLMY